MTHKEKSVQKAKYRKQVKFFNKKWLLLIAIIGVVVSIALIKNKKTDKVALSPELARSMEYDQVKEGDEEVVGAGNKKIESIQFDAYFIKDMNGDGTAETRLRGSCNEIGKHANIYMDLKVQNKGKVKNGKIAINSKNFTFKTALIKNEILKNDYMSNDTKLIELNDMDVGKQINIMGSIYSNVGYNNVPNLSCENNTIVFSGIFEDDDGTDIPFSKEVKLTVDWYGGVDCNIQKSTSVIVEDMDKLLTEDSLKLEFNVTTYESLNQLPMQEAFISGTIPALNGIRASSVEISGANVTYIYDQETGEFTAHKVAVQKEDESGNKGEISQNAYSRSSNYKRYTDFKFTVVYPKEAYEKMGEDIKTVQIDIPIEAINKGFNNWNNGFTNPFVSNTARDTVNVVFRVKEKEPDKQYNPSFSVNIGDYVSSPYGSYVIRKNKPLNIYNHISETEKDDTYLVTWRAYTGTKNKIDKIVMSEAKNDGKAGEETEEKKAKKYDEFEKNDGTHTSMEELTVNKGIYFSGADNTLGNEGWINVYDADTNTLIQKFTRSNWNLYSSSNPFIFKSPAKHIRIETSSANNDCYFYAYSVKELDDDYITSNFLREEFDTFKYIRTNLYGEATYTAEEGQAEKSKYTQTLSSKALYIAPTSIAYISLADNYIPISETKEREMITIRTDVSSYNTEKWKNGTFLVQIPSDIILAEVNEITTTNENVKIKAYDVYEEGKNFYIKILTENDRPEEFSIKIDCNLTPDPSITKKSVEFKLYATNEVASQYHYSKEDTYDVDGDSNKVEMVNCRSTSLSLETGSGLSTSQKLVDYDDKGSTTVAPRVGKADNEQESAKIQISATNNYTQGVKDIKIVGVLPFAGNDFVMGGNDLGSDYTVCLSEDGIKCLDSNLEGHYTVYYSESENPMEGITDENNSGWKMNGGNFWKEANDITDWSRIRSYIIVINNGYELQYGKKVEFEYTIDIPEGVKYNSTTYAEHAVDYALKTEEGLYYTSTASGKVGLMIAKQFELEIEKYQKDKDKKLQGITFSLTEDGQETSSIKSTDSNGKIVFDGLYTERHYTLKEQKVTDDYVLSDEEIKFYTYVEVDETGKETVHLVSDKEDSTSELKNLYKTVREASVRDTDNNDKADYKIYFEIENEPKAKLQITKTDKATNTGLKNAMFKITGKEKDETYTTNNEGKINISGLYLNEEYTLQELKLKDYYIPEGKIKFTITNENGTFKVKEYKDNGTTKDVKAYTEDGGTAKIETIDQIPTLKLELENEKIPSYKLKLTKYAKGEKDDSGEEKKLAKAQFQIFGEGISEKGKIYQTDEDGVLTIDNLYEFVDGKYIKGEYTLKEIYAPEGYSVNTEEFKFKVYHENGVLKFKIISGEGLIRTIEPTEEEPENGTGEQSEGQTESGGEPGSKDGNGATKKDIHLENSDAIPVLEIGVENSQIFSMFKYTKDGTKDVETPIKGARFVITDMDGEYVKGTDGKYVGEFFEYGEGTAQKGDTEGGNETAEQQGSTGGNQGSTDEKDSSEDGRVIKNERGIDISRYIVEDKESGKTGYYAVTTDENGKFTANLPEGLYKAIEIYVDEKYALPEDEEQRTYPFGVGASKPATWDWKNTIAGDGWDYINGISETNDGGLIGVGSFYQYPTELVPGSENGVDINQDGVIEEKSKGNNDGIIVRYDDGGNFEWSKPFGGDDDDALNKIIQTSDGGYMAVGYVSGKDVYYDEERKNDISKDYLTDGTNDKHTLGKKDAVMLKLDEDGNLKWGKRFGTTYNDELKSVIETKDGNFVVVGTSNNKGFVACYSADGKNEQWKKDVNNNTGYRPADVVEYSDGLAVAVNNSSTAYLYKYGLSDGNQKNSNISFGTSKITSLDIDKEGNIIAGVNSGSTFDANIYEIPPTATSSSNCKVLYTLKGEGSTLSSGGNLDDYVSSVKVTSDGGILFGGWYYSTKGLDVDGDKSIDGQYDFPELAGDYTSDGYIIKLDSENNVVYSSRFYGDGFEGVTSVAETKNGAMASGGYFSSPTFTATNFEYETEDSEEDAEPSKTFQLFEGQGNTEGFVVCEGASEAGIAGTLNLRVENKVRKFKVTTEVVKNNGVAGGNITGQTGTINGTQYSEDHIRYVEEVKYGENSTKEIVITPDKGTNGSSDYTIDYILINGKPYTEYTIDDEGKVTIPVFEDVKEDIHVQVKFSNTKSSIEVNHYLWKGSKESSTEKVADSTTETGTVGDEYKTVPNMDIEYEPITNEEFYGEGKVPEGKDADGIYVPDNYEGKYESGKKEVIDYYYKEKTYKVTVHHYIDGTNEKVPKKNGTEGETVDDEIIDNKKKGQDYTTEQATDEEVDYNIYELVQQPDNASGKIEGDTEVTYYYRIKQVSFEITKVEEENHERPIQGTEFALYQWNGTEESHDELLDKNNVDEEIWKLVKNYTSSSLGIVRFENLPITGEYRLIETKASEGRLIAEGQWKIEFVYDDSKKIEGDPSTVTIDGTTLKITAIGNPPAFAIKDGKLLIPNKEMFNFPLSGEFGVKNFYKYGLTIIAIGFAILILRKRLLITKNGIRKNNVSKTTRKMMAEKNANLRKNIKTLKKGRKNNRRGKH